MAELINRLEALAKQPNYRHITQYKLIGLEKECLRINHEGQLANNPHPKELGATLTHPHITTDFAESQLEIITKPHNNINNTFTELTELHSYIYAKISNKNLLWPNSMPGYMPAEKDILAARFGTSLNGQFKELYRQGLAHRYGKSMQLMCGVHFNFSFSAEFWQMFFTSLNNSPNYSIDDVNNQYFHIARNYFRISWIVTYLFGSCPFINKKLINNDTATANYLKPYDNQSYLAPFGTSIRESNLGYNNKTNLDLVVSYNNLDEYTSDLAKLVITEDADFKKLGLSRYDKPIQVNCNTLQIENEYYTVIRPKADLSKNSKFTRPYKALQQTGIAYLEFRNIDLNSLSPIGINQDQCLFLELIAYYCCLNNSPNFSTRELAHIKSNRNKTALLGRQPGLMLSKEQSLISLKDWAMEIFEDLKAIAHFLDNANHSDSTTMNQYSNILNGYSKLLKDANLTPSGIIYNNLIDNNLNYIDYNLNQAKLFQQYFAEHSRYLSPDKIDYYDKLSQDSILQQRPLEEIDAKNNSTLENFIAEHYAK